MLDLRFRPMPKWSEKTPLLLKEARFRTEYNRTLELLEYELGQLKAREIVIESGFTFAELRNDGWPRGGTTPIHPGVILYFHSKDGPLRFPCGTYNDYRDNLHAIALTLENLRAIDRYGVTLGHQQYLGFAALPAAGIRTVEDAAMFLAAQGRGRQADSEFVMRDKDAMSQLYRLAAARLHPDNPASGNADLWRLLQESKRLLDAHHSEATRA